MDKLAEYGKKLNNYVLRNDGDVFDLKKLADELSRDFYKDVVELKAWKIGGRQYAGNYETVCFTRAI